MNYPRCKAEVPLQAIVVGLLLCCASALAQENTGAPPSGTNAKSTFGEDHLEPVSSDEFERFLASTSTPLQMPPATPLTPLPSPLGNASMDVAASIIEAQAPSLPPFTSQPSHLEHPPKDGLPTLPINTDEQVFVPWWQELTLQPLLSSNKQLACQFDLEQLVWLSMQHSPRVQSILIVPQIQRTESNVAAGEFDPRRFGQSIYHNTSDPVGNTLTTGGPSRLNEEFWQNSVGIRDRNVLGGKTELSQAIDARDSNSLFFQPNNQADTKLSLNYTQPLMRGAGRFYNTSAIQLAGIKTQETIATANRELQFHAMDVISAYWELTLHRYLLAQARISQERLIQIKRKLEDRAGMDLLSNFVSRAKAAIAKQQQQIEIAKATIKAQEAILRQLVNAPELENSICQEIIPLTIPDIALPGEILEDELWSAVKYRGDVVAIQQTIESAVVQRKVAKHELKPTLDLIADSYVRGLRGDNQFLESWTNQFDTGRPSFSSGLTYQAPVGNRAAKANLKGRDLEIQKLIYDYSNALKTARAEIESVVEESKGTFAAAQSSIVQIIATQDEVQLQESKADSFFGDNPSVSNQLNELLDAIGRLTEAENQMADRQIRHMLALAKIKFESGTLMTITAE